MIRADRERIYLFALKDIHTIISEYAPLDLLRYLTADGAYSVLQRYTDLPMTASSYLDVDSDFRRICQGLHRASEQFLESPWARACWGRALVALGRYKGAICEFEGAAKMAPECALLAIFAGEAYYYLAGWEFADSLDHYMAAICYLSDAITLKPEITRPYLCRAHCQAHVLHLCGYTPESVRFKLYYEKICDDLLTAKRNSAISSLPSIAVVEQEIHTLLGIESTQIQRNS